LDESFASRAVDMYVVLLAASVISLTSNAGKGDQECTIHY
jgi:hypothetical protein